MGNCDTDLEGHKLYVRDFLQKLTGENLNTNQFGTFTLYRCHCGCDDCGLVSCEIIVTETQVIWQNVGYENDFIIDKNELDASEIWQLTRLNFTFDKADYFLRKFNVLSKV